MCFATSSVDVVVFCDELCWDVDVIVFGMFCDELCGRENRSLTNIEIVLRCTGRRVDVEMHFVQRLLPGVDGSALVHECLTPPRCFLQLFQFSVLVELESFGFLILLVDSGLCNGS